MNYRKKKSVLIIISSLVIFLLIGFLLFFYFNFNSTQENIAGDNIRKLIKSATELQSIGRFEKSELLYREALDLYPDSDLLKEKYVGLLVKIDKADTAREVARSCKSSHCKSILHSVVESCQYGYKRFHISKVDLDSLFMCFYDQHYSNGDPLPHACAANDLIALVEAKEEDWDETVKIIDKLDSYVQKAREDIQKSSFVCENEKLLESVHFYKAILNSRDMNDVLYTELGEINDAKSVDFVVKNTDNKSCDIKILRDLYYIKYIESDYEFIRKKVHEYGNQNKFSKDLVKFMCRDKIELKKLIKELKMGAAIDSKDMDDNDLLICAIKQDDEDVIRYLLTKGANINTVNSLRESALQAAMMYKRDNVFKLLLKNGAFLENTDLFGSTELMRAMHKVGEKYFMELIRLGANINAKDCNGSTALHYQSINVDDDYKVIEKVQTIGKHKILINAGADINSVNRFGETPLMSAVRRGDKNVIKVLIEHDTDKNIKNNFGQTALDIAKKEGKNDIIWILK